MNQRFQWLTIALVVVIFGGCCNCRRGGGLFSNIGAARIAPPGTGVVRLPNVANVPEPYYNANASQQPQINAQPGWRPAGAVPTQPTTQNIPRTTNPTSFNVPSQLASLTIPPNNLTTASNTTVLSQPGQLPAATANVSVQPSRVQAAPQLVSLPANAGGNSGGMPLSDATLVSAPGVIPQRPTQAANTTNGTWEYIARPVAPQYQARQYQSPQYQMPQYPAPAPRGVIASSSTSQFSRPRLSQYPANQSVVQQPLASGQGWRQRDNQNGLPR